MSRRPLPSTLNQLHVLLVEDHPLNQMVVAGMLEDLGATVDVANDGIDAQSFLSPTGTAYHWVITDLQMPEMDGLGLTRWLRAHPDWADVRIMGMTANALDDDLTAAQTAGMDLLLTKPFEPEQLSAVLLGVQP